MTQRSPHLAEFCVDSSTIPPVSRLSPTLRLLLALLLCLGAWYWLRAIFVPGNTAQAQADITGNQLAPSNDAESAIVSTLQPGNYTAILSGKDNGTGVGLIEVYNLDAN